jgi:hypothetical protein
VKLPQKDLKNDPIQSPIAEQSIVEQNMTEFSKENDSNFRSKNITSLDQIQRVTSPPSNMRTHIRLGNEKKRNLDLEGSIETAKMQDDSKMSDNTKKNVNRDTLTT